MQQLYDLVERLASTLNTNAGFEMAEAIRKRDWNALNQVDVAPQHFADSEAYWKHSQVKELLRKGEFLTGDPEPLKQKALGEFYRCEALNFASNRRVRSLLQEHIPFGASELRIFEFFEDVKREIKRCLGPLPDFDQLSPRFGPGATFSERRPVCLMADKNSNLPTLTPGAWPFIPDWERTAWSRAVRGKSPHAATSFSFSGYCKDWSEPARVRGNRFTTVPKDAFKRRGICVEPSLNVFYQLGVGGFIRARLKKVFHIDLQYGQADHREMARWGSAYGGLATIDLTSASDLVCYELVRALVPPLWFELLDSLRSPFTFVNGKWIKLEKFSSMGNGYTFELETLIFAAICRVVSKRHGFEPDELAAIGMLGQYGDDCIIPTELVDDVLAAFRWCGFQTNVKKSFWSGPFRESCGGDFFAGVDVRTYKLTDDLNEPQKWISFLNGLWSVARPDLHHPDRVPFLRDLYRYGLANLPNHIRRLKGPEHLGDLVIHGTLDSKKSASSLHVGGVTYWRGWLPIPGLVPWSYFSPGARLASALMGASSEGLTSLTEPITGYRVGWIGIPDDAPWGAIARRLLEE